MRKRTFEHNGAKITVHASTGGDLLDRQYIIQVMNADDSNLRHLNRVFEFAKIVTQTEKVSGKLGVKIPSVDAPPEELRKAFDMLMEGDGELLLNFQRACREVDQAPGDPDLHETIDEDSADPKS